MRRRLRALGAVLLLSAAMPAASRPAAAAESCAAPHDIVRLRGLLPRTAERLGAHEQLTVVALGSSSTFGYGASTPFRSYPSQLEALLKRRLPGESLAVLNRGVNGETAVEMATRLDRDVLPLEPDLVIWQVGTNAVIRGHETARDIEPVRRGLRRLRAAGIDVVLMDMQYAPMVLARPGWHEMEEALSALARDEGVPLFRRFELMRYWVEQAGMPMSSVVSGDGLHLNDFSYRCVARHLGDAILEEAAPRLASRRR